MAKQSINTMQFNYPPDVVFEVLTAPAFQEQNFKNQGNPDAKVTETSRTDDRLTLIAEVTEYAKGITGVDKSKTEQTTTHYDWNIPKKTCQWTYTSPHAQVKVWGAIRIEAAGDGTRLTEEFNVNVSIPLMGGKIEKMVIKEVEKFWPAYRQLVEEFCAKAR